MFTYFSLKAVIGGADSNNAKQVMFQEIYNLVAGRLEGVPYYEKRQHRDRMQESSTVTRQKTVDLDNLNLGLGLNFIFKNPF